MKLVYSALALAFVLSANAQKPITTIPFELYGDHMMIQVSIDNSKPLDFIFDTGSGLTVLDSDVQADLKLSGKKIKMNEPTTSFELIKHNEIEINGFPMEKNIKVYATDLDHLEISLGRDIDGIVGYDLMRHHTLYLDYENKKMEIYEHHSGPTAGDAIPFEMVLSIPVIKGNVVLNNNEAHPGTFFIMSGAGTTLDFNSPYAKKYDVVNKTGKHYSYVVKGITNEETVHYEGHVLSLEFGKQRIEDLPIGISEAKSGIQAHEEVSGIIGNEILSMFNITIDVPNEKLYFQKNAIFGQIPSVNCSGIDLQLSKDKKDVLIHQVFTDSPAANAGVKINDQLVAINGTPVGELDLPDIKNMLKQAGKSVSLKISRSGSTQDISFVMKSLIE